METDESTQQQTSLQTSTQDQSFKDKVLNQRGNFIIFLGAILVILVIGVGGYLLVINKNQNVNQDTFQPTLTSIKPTPISTLSNVITFIKNGDLYLYRENATPELLVKSGRISKAVVSPDTSKLFYAEDILDKPIPGGYRQSYTIYNLANKETIPLSNSIASIIEWSNDGKKLIGQDSNFDSLVYDITQKKERTVLTWDMTCSSDDESDNCSYRASISPTGERVAYIRGTNKLFVKNILTDTITFLGQEDRKKRLLLSIFWNPEGKTMVVTRADITGQSFGEELLIFPATATSSNDATIVNGIFLPGNDAPHPVLWSPVGDKLLLFDTSQIIDVKNGRLIKSFKTDELRKYVYTGASEEKVLWLTNDNLMVVGNDPDRISDGVISENDHNLVLLDIPSGKIQPFTVNGICNISAVIPSKRAVLIEKCPSNSIYEFDLDTQQEKLLLQ